MYIDQVSMYEPHVTLDIIEISKHNYIKRLKEQRGSKVFWINVG